jgi:hypothetical protein
MKIEDGEVVFGKRWNQWTPDEWREFARVLEVTDMGYPIYLNCAMNYIDEVSTEVHDFLVGHFPQESRERVAN